MYAASVPLNMGGGGMDVSSCVRLAYSALRAWRHSLHVAALISSSSSPKLKVGWVGHPLLLLCPLSFLKSVRLPVNQNAPELEGKKKRLQSQTRRGNEVGV